MELRKIKKNKKGSMIDIVIFVVMAFVIVMFFGLWVYGFDRLTNILTGIKGSATVNISDASQKTFGQVNTAQTTGLHVLAYIMIFMSAISILLSNFLVKSHPAFFIVFLMVIIGAFIASVYISNQYELLMQNAVFGSTLSDFKGGSFILLYLPIWVAVIGVFGAIFLFAGIIRDYGQGGSVI